MRTCVALATAVWALAAAAVGVYYACLAQEPGPAARRALERGAAYAGPGTLRVPAPAHPTVYGPKEALDVPMLVASQTKLVTARVVHAVMQRNASSLHLDARPSDFFEEWPTTGRAGAVRLRHLLTFTTGIAPRDSRKSCVEAGGADVAGCVARVGTDYAFTDDPGARFVYASWHLYVAAAMTLRAARRPLTKAAWIDLVHEHVYVPAGLGHVTPAFPNADCLLPGVACWLAQRHMAHVSGGLRITGHQLSSVLATTPNAFWEDSVALARNASTLFAYGHWIEDGANATTTTVHVTSGMHGAYAWVTGREEERGVVAVLVYSWWSALRRAILLALVFAGATTLAIMWTSRAPFYDLSSKAFIC